MHHKDTEYSGEPSWYISQLSSSLHKNIQHYLLPLFIDHRATMSTHQHKNLNKAHWTTQWLWAKGCSFLLHRMKKEGNRDSSRSAEEWRNARGRNTIYAKPITSNSWHQSITHNWCKLREHFSILKSKLECLAWDRLHWLKPPSLLRFQPADNNF